MMSEDTPSQAAARAWLHGYGINTSRYRDHDDSGDHPAMLSLPTAFERFAADKDAEIQRLRAELAALQQPATEEELVEVAARAIHRDECDQEEAALRAEKRSVPAQWADPWSPSGVHQRRRYERIARAVLAAIGPRIRAPAWQPMETFDADLYWAQGDWHVMLSGVYPNGVRWVEEGHFIGHHPPTHKGHWSGRKFDIPDMWLRVYPPVAAAICTGADDAG